MSPRFIFHPPMRALLFTIAVIVVLSIAMEFLRLSIVEPETVAVNCALDGAPWICKLRAVLTYGFTRNLFGWVSMLAGIFAMLIRWRWVAVIAIVAGIAGAVLYHFELSGVGLLLGALVLARGVSAVSSVDTRTQQIKN